MHPLTLIALVTFALIVCGLYLLLRKGTWTLEDLSWLQGETKLFEEDIRYFDAFIRGTEALRDRTPRARIVVTNRRLLLAQKFLFSKKHLLRYALNYVDPGPPLTQEYLLGGGLLAMRKTRENFMTLYTSPDRIKVTPCRGRPVVEITVPFPDHGPLFGEPKFRIFSRDPERYRELKR